MAEIICMSYGCKKEIVTDANWHTKNLNHCDKHCCKVAGCSGNCSGMSTNVLPRTLELCPTHRKGLKVFLVRCTESNGSISYLYRDCQYLTSIVEMERPKESVLFVDRLDAEKAIEIFKTKWGKSAVDRHPLEVIELIHQ